MIEYYEHMWIKMGGTKASQVTLEHILKFPWWGISAKAHVMCHRILHCPAPLPRALHTWLGWWICPLGQAGQICNIWYDDMLSPVHWIQNSRPWSFQAFAFNWTLIPYMDLVIHFLLLLLPVFMPYFPFSFCTKEAWVLSWKIPELGLWLRCLSKYWHLSCAVTLLKLCLSQQCQILWSTPQSNLFCS